MAVYYQQLVDGEAIDPEAEVEPHSPEQTDEELLLAKYNGAQGKGWDVEWLIDTMFVARKVRWNPDSLCERIFRII